MESFHLLSIPIIVVDESLMIVFANRAVAAIAGNYDRIHGEPVSSLFPYPEESKTIETLVRRAFKEKMVQVREGAWRMHGPLVWARFRVEWALHDGRDVVTIAVENQKDEIRPLGTRKYKQLLSILPIGIAEFALREPIPYNLPDDQLTQAVFSAKVEDANDEYSRMTGGGDFATVSGVTLEDFNPRVQEYRDLYLMWLRKFFPTGSFEIRETAKDGSALYSELTLVGEVDGDSIVGFWELRRDITASKQAEQKLKSSFNRLKRTLYATVDAMSSVVEKRDPYTAGHQKRVARLALAVAEEMGLSEDHCTGIHLAASIHDIGKIYVPAEFLSKPGKLDESERVILRHHPAVGHDILKDIEFPWPIAKILLQHHERIDGSGYPQGLTGEETLLEARIVAVADVVEAMSSHRPYRPSLGLEPALQEIEQNGGIAYDQDVVNACLAVMEGGFSF